jgi:hypothetical protein
MPSNQKSWAPGYLRTRGLRGNEFTKPRNSSRGLRRSFRGQPRVERPPRCARNKFPRSGASPEVPSPSAFPRTGQLHDCSADALPSACVYRFSQPPDAFLRPVPAGPYFRPDPLLGFSLQSLVPPAQPHAVSGAVALVSLGHRPYPRPAPSRRSRSSAPVARPQAVGEAPPSGPCSTRESDRPGRWFRPTRARSSLGIHPLQGTPSRWNGTAFTAPPLLWLPQPTSGRNSTTGSCLPASPAGLTWRLPALLGFRALCSSRTFERQAVRESPPRRPGCVTAP